MRIHRREAANPQPIGPAAAPRAETPGAADRAAGPARQNRVGAAPDELGRAPGLKKSLLTAGAVAVAAYMARGVHNLSLGQGLFDNLPEVPKQALPSGTIMLWRPHPDDPPEWYAGDPTHHKDQKAIETGHSSLDFAVKGHKVGDVSTGHVALWTKNPGDAQAPEICEAGGEGVKCSPLPRGRWVAYKPASEAMGNKASEIAQRWLKDGSIPYSKLAVGELLLRAQVHPAGVFDTRAAGEAAIREACREDEKGHPNFVKTDPFGLGAQGTFCSELVTYAYRCAAQELNEKTVIPLIPEHTSPLAMHNLMLESGDFVALGIVKEEGPNEALADSKNAADPKNLAGALTTHYGINL